MVEAIHATGLLVIALSIIAASAIVWGEDQAGRD